MDLTLTAKGQVTFNKALLEHMGVRPGEKISVMCLPDGCLEISAASRRISFADFHKIAKEESRKVDTGVRMSVDDIRQAIASSYVERGSRGLP